ncbi:MAG TPA: fused MFS/spermidine synthase [Pirellulales bacterium]|jgi:hypothetical protein|nr:fused MFS/spermidine synthase [Pirellulales bacterium]
MILYAVAIFLSAFLLFQVQPLIGRFILPWFGGTPAVWTTCMLLFQLLLLAGYAYAHALATWLRARRQAALHLVLLAVSVAMLPIIPNESWRPLDDRYPVLRILALLTCTIGAPYLLLSSTGPLLQHWFSGIWPGRSPYRLYALSNVGSLLALVTYPFVFEPSLTLGVQAYWWSAAYLAFVGGCACCAVQLMRSSTAADTAWDAARATGTEAKLPASAEQQRTREPVVYWFALSAVGSTMLLATTNQVCQEVAVVPFLWILPLALYLLTFIICFDSPQWYRRGIFGPLLAGSIVAACYVLEEGPVASLWQQLGAYSAALFAGCMTCHGELVASRPNPRRLTLFYLTIAAGGAAGGLFVAVIAPAVFKGYWEYHVALVGCALAAIVGYGRDRRSPLYGGRPLIVWLAIYSGVVVLCVYLVKHAWSVDADAIESDRNFYGVVRVRDRSDEQGRSLRELVHGRILHGLQYLDGPLTDEPVSYYSRSSGIGLAIEHHPRRAVAESDDPPFRIGVVGLGAGTLAAYGEPGDRITFYEINPVVERLARKYFTYLSHAKAPVEIILGDARTQMQHQLRENRPQQFDVLAIDAFSSDAIPMHLLTLEAFELYRAHLRDDGLLVLHVSSNHLDLNPVVLGLAERLGCDAVRIVAEDDRTQGQYESEWLVVTTNRDFLTTPAVISAMLPWPDDVRPIVWTDDFGSLWQVLGKPEELSSDD